MKNISLSQARIASNVHGLLYADLSEDYEVFMSSIALRGATLNSYVYPDVAVVAGEVVLDTNEPVAVLLNPLLIVEVLPEHSYGYEKMQHFMYYQGIITFQEYLLIEQQQAGVMQWCKTRAGEWEQSTYTRLDEVIALHSVPTDLLLGEVYRRVVFDTVG